MGLVFVDGVTNGIVKANAGSQMVQKHSNIF